MSNNKIKGRSEHWFGATGMYPQGHLNDDDEGELRLGIGQSEGKVIINFGKSITWIAFDADQAIEIAGTILVEARKIKGELSHMKEQT